MASDNGHLPMACGVTRVAHDLVQQSNLFTLSLIFDKRSHEHKHLTIGVEIRTTYADVHFSNVRHSDPPLDMLLHTSLPAVRDLTCIQSP